MGARKTTTARKTTRINSKKSEHWKSLPRDSRGRWIKSRKKKNLAQKRSNLSKKLMPSSKIAKKTAVKAQIPAVRSRTKSIDKSTTKLPAKMHVKTEMFVPHNTICPRCGGDMHTHRIRCGPNRLVSVEKCEICNFWLPIGEQGVSQQKQQAVA